MGVNSIATLLLLQSHFRVREAVKVPPTNGLTGKPGGSV
jgi:hypothetical protein